MVKQNEKEIKRMTLILNSGSLDKAYSALTLGSGAVSMGWQCSIYCTFNGLKLLTKKGLEGNNSSKMNVKSLEESLKKYRELGGKIIACEKNMEVMDLSGKDLREELIDDYGSIETYLKDAKDADVTLFI